MSIFREGETLIIDTSSLIKLFEDAWKYDIKAAGKPKEMWERINVEWDEYGPFNALKETEIKVGNIRFHNMCEYNGGSLHISVTIGGEEIQVYNYGNMVGYHDPFGKIGWLYPIDTLAIQEILRFLKALEGTVNIARGREFNQKQILDKKEAEKRFKSFMRRKTKLDSFNINLEE